MRRVDIKVQTARKVSVGLLIPSGYGGVWFALRWQAQLGFGVKDVDFFHVKRDVDDAVSGKIRAIKGENLDRVTRQRHMNKG